jgi:hypothetical protein
MKVRTLFLTLLLCTTLAAQQYTPYSKEPKKLKKTSSYNQYPGYLAFRASGYYPVDKAFRNVYEDRGIYGMEGGYHLYKSLYLYSAVQLFPSSGQTLPNHDSIRLLLVPIEAGLKNFFQTPIPRLQVFAAIGITPFYIHVKDDYPFVLHKRVQWDIGGSFSSGIRLFKNRNLFLDAIFNYYYLKTHFSSTDQTVGQDSDFSGLAIGFNFGYAF